MMDFLIKLFARLSTNTAKDVDIVQIEMPIPSMAEIKKAAPKKVVFDDAEIRKKIRYLFSELGFPVDDDIIIFGLQDDSDWKKDVINDLIGAFTPFKLSVAVGTCGPGLHYTKKQKHHPKFDGCSHLFAARLEIERGPGETARWGYQEKIWTVDHHRGFRPALRQIGWRARIYSDVEGNYVKDDTDPVKKVYEGINCHYASVRKKIGRASAACQVIFGKAKFLEHMDVVTSSARYQKSKGTLFSYGLIRRSLVDEIMGDKFFNQLWAFAARSA